MTAKEAIENIRLAPGIHDNKDQLASLTDEIRIIKEEKEKEDDLLNQTQRARQRNLQDSTQVQQNLHQTKRQLDSFKQELSNLKDDLASKKFELDKLDGELGKKTRQMIEDKVRELFQGVDDRTHIEIALRACISVLKDQRIFNSIKNLDLDAIKRLTATEQEKHTYHSILNKMHDVYLQNIMLLGRLEPEISRFLKETDIPELERKARVSKV